MISLRRCLSVTTATLLATAVLAGCGNEEQVATQESCAYPSSGAEPARAVEVPPSEPELADELTATLDLGQGPVTVHLTPERTACTVNNFTSLVEQGWYDDTECHRLTTAGIHVLQCGDPTASGRGGPGWTIPDEVDGSETYPAGTVAMAKTPAPDSGGSQFFLVHDDSPLPPEYTVFGTMDDESVALLREIAASGVEGGGTDGVPVERVTIRQVDLT